MQKRNSHVQNSVAVPTSRKGREKWGTLIKPKP
jgi:hypothetical protein